MVGCAKREGRGNRGAWAAPAGFLGGRPLWEPLFLPRVLRGPHFDGRVGEPASEGRAAGNGFREKGQRDSALAGREEADLRGGGTVPSQGERAGSDPKGPDHCHRRLVGRIGARGPVGSGGSESHSVPAQPREEKRPARLALCGKG